MCGVCRGEEAYKPLWRHPPGCPPSATWTGSAGEGRRKQPNLHVAVGQESNGVQTMPGKSCNTLFRLYAPLRPASTRPGSREMSHW
jgi:hypothetical protein